MGNASIGYPPPPLPANALLAPDGPFVLRSTLSPGGERVPEGRGEGLSLAEVTAAETSPHSHSVAFWPVTAPENPRRVSGSFAGGTKRKRPRNPSRGASAVVLGGTAPWAAPWPRRSPPPGARRRRRAERGAREERVGRIEAGGGRSLFQAADALDRDSLARARDAIAGQLGTVSVLVNAAGGNRPDATLAPGADFCRLPREAWQGVFDLNLVGGVLLPCQVFGESMLAAGRGSVINIASMAGMTPLSPWWPTRRPRRR